MSLEGMKIALVEDDLLMGESLLQSLTLEGARVNWWQTGKEALTQLPGATFDIVLCDIRLPDMNGEQVFSQLVKSAPLPPFMFITAFADIDQAVLLMRLGAADYLTKPFEMLELIERVKILAGPSRPYDEMQLGVSEEMCQLETQLHHLASGNSTILLTGETGSGKEVCARFLHCSSNRHEQPFIAVNCAAIPSDLMESELFGHEKGAFSGATRQHKGYAERAANGILFLDEIGDLPLRLQSRLLRLIEDRHFYRVGGEQSVEFTARIVSATNADLKKMIDARSFRADLYYRINVVALEVPPLRERQKDIPWLLARFFNDQVALQDSPLRTISSLAELAAIEHDWPGNVRELRNRVERGVALSKSAVLSPGDLFPEIHGSLQLHEQMISLAQAREEAEKKHIARALHKTQGQIIEAAKLLGISRTTIWDKMRRYNLPGIEH